MRRLVAFSIQIACSFGVVAQELPPAREFLVCMHLYHWVQTRIAPESPMMEHLKASANMFEGSALILSGGIPNRYESDMAGVDFRALMMKAAEQNKRISEFYDPIDAACYEKQRQFTPKLLRKSEENAKVLEPYLTHQLPKGEVDAQSIEKRQDFIKSHPGVSIDHGKNTVTYSFTRKIGDAQESVQHIFTKAGNHAHPAVIFYQSRKTSVNGPPTNTVVGSYAGSKSEFDGLYAAFVLMNQRR